MTLVFRFTSDTAGEIRSQTHQGSMGKIHPKFTMNSKVVHNYSSSLSWIFLVAKPAAKVCFTTPMKLSHSRYNLYKWTIYMYNGLTGYKVFPLLVLI